MQDPGRTWPGPVAGTITLPYDGAPVRIDYTFTTDAGWATRTVNSRPRPDLDGCIDVDLGWTPATNDLPLRRIPCCRRVDDDDLWMATWLDRF